MSAVTDAPIARGARDSTRRHERSPRAAFISTYRPRQCGIATFCEDLVQAAGDGGSSDAFVIAMDRPGSGLRYESPVALVVDECEERGYRAAGDLIDSSSIDVVSVQHEFGIFGGPECPHLALLLASIRKPVITTLHTVVPQPDSLIRERIVELTELSRRVVVMNPLAIEILDHDYGVDTGKVSFIHHGVPVPSAESREEAKARLGLTGRMVLSTFGLVGRGKGLEHAIGAMPEVIGRHPEAIYLIVGETHPLVRQSEQESYREELLALVERLGLVDHVVFVNRYVTKDEILRYLTASDVYLTPYPNVNQITSGTLAYAAAAGAAIVSTPYLYARFLLADGRGLLVEARSESAIARSVTRLLDDPGLRSTIAKRAADYGRRMYWPIVGAAYVSLFREVMQPVEAARTTGWPAPRSLQIARRNAYDGRAGRPGPFAQPFAAAD
ncbi:MAG: glycosyltransferase family 4 protein [Armatimonadota bacterium]